MSSAKTLVCPLNWGLGHATRCIPLIRDLMASGQEVILGSDGIAFELLAAEFPDCEMVELPSYRIRYQTENMVYNIATQLPRILWAIRAEHHMVKKLVEKRGIQRIISDNRFGCYAPNVHSIFITHQLQIRTKSRFTSFVANALMRHAVKHFQEIWVPDTPESDQNLSGELSHGPNCPPNTHYIGPLSRFKEMDLAPKYDVAIVLSGPEPQRTKFEQLLMEQALALPYQFIFIQGNPHIKQHYFAAEHVEVVSNLPSDALNTTLCAARMVVCRSGYSSLMDLAVLGKKALLVPTPGQTEQEYLAEKHAQSGTFVVQNQGNLDLKKGLAALESL